MKLIAKIHICHDESGQVFLNRSLTERHLSDEEMIKDGMFN